MGLFQHKQTGGQLPDDELTEGIGQFFDGYFQELNDRGQAYFDEVVESHKAKFEEELDSTMSQISADMRAYITKRIDEQIAENGRALKEAQAQALESINQGVQSLQRQHQDLSVVLEEQFAQSESAIKSAQAKAIESMNRSVDTLQEQHRNLTNALQKNVARQDGELTVMIDQTKKQITEVQTTQKTALDSLKKAVETMQAEQNQLEQILQQKVQTQEKILVTAFEQNTAQIIEHYLLDALGDQYDMKAQLPAIIQQMEQNKKEIVDDITS